MGPSHPGEENVDVGIAESVADDEEAVVASNLVGRLDVVGGEWLHKELVWLVQPRDDRSTPQRPA